MQYFQYHWIACWFDGGCGLAFTHVLKNEIFFRGPLTESGALLNLNHILFPFSSVQRYNIKACKEISFLHLTIWNIAARLILLHILHLWQMKGHKALYETIFTYYYSRATDTRWGIFQLHKYYTTPDKTFREDHLSFGHTQQIADPNLILGVRITKPL